MNKQIVIVGFLVAVFFLGKKLLTNVSYYLRSDSIRSEVELKLNERAWELKQAQIGDYFHIMYDKELIEVADRWKNNCENNLNYYCRLYSDLIYFKEGEKKGLQTAIKYCDMNSLQACIALSKMKGFSSSHSKYFNVTNTIISQCED